MNKPILDLTQDKCHVCNRPMLRNTNTQYESCINPFCLIRNIDFSIPYLQEKKA